MTYTFFAEDGSNIECTVMGVGMDSGDKAANKAMAIAHKYALLQIFCVPTIENDDPDKESHETISAQPVISTSQLTRLKTIASKSGKSIDDIKLILKEYGYESSKEIHPGDYDAICEKISHTIGE
jgi:hypothetical protein